MAVSDLVDICSHLTIHGEFDLYPLLDEGHDKFLIDKAVEGVWKHNKSNGSFANHLFELKILQLTFIAYTNNI